MGLILWVIFHVYLETVSKIQILGLRMQQEIIPDKALELDGGVGRAHRTHHILQCLTDTLILLLIRIINIQLRRLLLLLLLLLLLKNLL